MLQGSYLEYEQLSGAMNHSLASQWIDHLSKLTAVGKCQTLYKEGMTIDQGEIPIVACSNSSSAELLNF